MNFNDRTEDVEEFLDSLGVKKQITIQSSLKIKNSNSNK